MQDTDSNSDNGTLPCHEKMAFDTQKEAASAGLAAEWQHGGALKAYRCRYCRLWHLATEVGE